MCCSSTGHQVTGSNPGLDNFFFAKTFAYLSPFYLYTQKEGQIASPFASPLLALFPARPKGPWHGAKPLEPLLRPFSKGLSPMASAAHRHASKTIGVETPHALLKTLTAGTLLALGPQRQIGPDPGTSAPNWLGTPDLGGPGSPRGGLVYSIDLKQPTQPDHACMNSHSVTQRIQCMHA